MSSSRGQQIEEPLTRFLDARERAVETRSRVDVVTVRVQGRPETSIGGRRT